MLRHISLLVVALAACTQGPTSKPATVNLTPCRVGELGLSASCGTLKVFEDRAASTGRTIDLNIAVLRARVGVPKPDPLFILVGGPGQSATRSGVMMAAVLRHVRRDRDIVLVDQRGTGKSNPLNCEPDEQESLNKMLTVSFDPEEVTECADALEADPRHYTTPVAMDDLDEVRAALGYDKINLWGGSYGTRAALEYSRRHPEHTRRLVLDGSAPTDIRLIVHAGRDAQRALDLMFKRCENDDACAQRFTDARTRFDSLLTELQTTPRTVRLPHPRTGASEEITIGRDAFAAMVRTVLYVPSLVALLPFALDRAIADDWGPLLAAFLSVADSIQSDLAVGMFLSVVCAEDIPQISAEQRSELQRNFLGDVPLSQLTQTCAHWPAATMPASYFEPITTTQPTLLLSGDLDPVTPPAWGDLVASRLTHALHVVVPGAAHNVSQLPCVTDAIERFLDATDPMALEIECSSESSHPLVTRLAGEGP